MKYELLGEDSSTTAEKLSQYTGEVDWSYLKPHYKSGVLYFVDPSLTLEKVGEVICRDDKATVSAWLHSGELVKIERLHAQQWEDCSPTFKAVVVSPFVLCQLLPTH